MLLSIPFYKNEESKTVIILYRCLFYIWITVATRAALGEGNQLSLVSVPRALLYLLEIHSSVLQANFCRKWHWIVAYFLPSTRSTYTSRIKTHRNARKACRSTETLEYSGAQPISQGLRLLNDKGNRKERPWERTRLPDAWTFFSFNLAFLWPTWKMK